MFLLTATQLYFSLISVFLLIRFELRTQEATQLKMELDKAQETIQAAETLVSKLDGEFKRWSGQVRCTITINSRIYRIYSINRPGRLLNFWTLRVGAYSRWALIQGWALIQINTVINVSLLKTELRKLCLTSEMSGALPIHTYCH